MSLKCLFCKEELSPERMCRLCGATMQISEVSGNIIWMRNGRVVAAPQDEKDAWVKMAKAHWIPESEWPERFRGE